MSNITSEEIQSLEAATTAQQWNDATDKIKAAHGGYPSDWFAKVSLSGLGDRVASRFNQSYEVKIKPIANH